MSDNMTDPRCGKVMRSGQLCGRSAGHPGRHLGEDAYRKQMDKTSRRRGDGTIVIGTHGYGGYGRGCKCGTCRAAKAAYHRKMRAEAIAKAAPGVAVEGVKHGTRGAYREKGCRCEACVTFMRETWKRWDVQQGRRSRGRRSAVA